MTDAPLRLVAVDLGKPATVGRVVIEQAYPELKRVKKFAIAEFNPAIVYLDNISCLAGAAADLATAGANNECILWGGVRLK